MTPQLFDQHAWRVSHWRWPALVVGLGGLILHHHAAKALTTRWPRGTLGFAVLGMVVVLALLSLACYSAITWFDSRLGTLRRNQPKWSRNDRWFPLRRYGAAALVDFLVIAAAFALWLSWWPWIAR
jgi:hypothetical protein